MEQAKGNICISCLMEILSAEKRKQDQGLQERAELPEIVEIPCGPGARMSRRRRNVKRRKVERSQHARKAQRGKRQKKRVEASRHPQKRRAVKKRAAKRAACS